MQTNEISRGKETAGYKGRTQSSTLEPYEDNEDYNYGTR